MNNRSQLEMAQNIVDTFNGVLDIYGDCDITPLQILNILGVCGFELVRGEQASKEYCSNMTELNRSKAAHPTRRLHLVPNSTTAKD